jgi:hypothetical protein
MGENSSPTTGRAREDIVRIIERLQRLTPERGATPEEAAVAAAKAQELIYKYQVELSEVADAGDDDVSEVFTVEPFGLGVVFGQMTDWRRLLLSHICTANFCKAVYHEGRNWRQSYGRAGKSAEEVMTVVGQPTNLKLVRWMYDYLTEALEGIAKDRWAALRGPIQRGTAVTDEEMAARVEAKRTHPLRWKDSFFKGAVTTVGYRLQNEKQRFARTNERTTALVRREEYDLLDAVRHAFPRLSAGGRSEVGSSGAFRAGQQAGRRISLNTPVEGGQGPRPLP